MNKKAQYRTIGPLETLEYPGDPEKGTLILLHGFGADASDLFSLNEICPGPQWLFPRAPLPIHFAQGFTGRAWFDINIPLLTQTLQENRLEEISRAFPSELTSACALIEAMIEELKIPKSKIILGGFSQGAILAIDTVLSGNEPFGGLLIFSGALIKEAEWRREASKHAGTPFFQSHGTYDTLLPFKNAERLNNLLIDEGLSGVLHTFLGGHEIPQTTLIQCSTFLKKLISHF